MTQELLSSTHLGGAQVVTKHIIDDVSRPFPLWYSPAQLIPHTNSQPTVCSPISFQWEFPVSFLVLCTYMYSFGFVITYRVEIARSQWYVHISPVNSYMYCIIVAVEAHIGKANITVSTSNLCTSSKAAHVLSDNVFRCCVLPPLSTNHVLVYLFYFVEHEILVRALPMFCITFH